MTVLEIENISKQYRLGLVGTGTLSDDLKRWWFRIRGKEDPFLKVGDVNTRSTYGDSDYVWALKDISIKVKEGEVLGIIGKNGAGKSTLLKILSRVTSPTAGEIRTKGRIASLLEVGTGFHPELTGRENMYLNGAILGMNKAEIKTKEDEIIEFSGCQRYIDTPVKRYSSGMRVRLAFAVAAFLEPDILVIDEVLAVGDAEFQKKAIGKMQDISTTDGRTVLFVSHNMGAIQSLCTRAVLLEDGIIAYEGDTNEAVSRYLKQGASIAGEQSFKDVRFNTHKFYIKNLSVSNPNKLPIDPILETESVEVKLNIKIKEDSSYHVTYHLTAEDGSKLFSFSNIYDQTRLNFGHNNLVCSIPAHFLQSGQYFLSLLIVENKKQVIFKENDLVSFMVVDGSRNIGTYMGREPGYIRPQFNWHHKHD